MLETSWKPKTLLLLSTKIWGISLRVIYITWLLKMAICSGFTYWKWWFSVVFCMFTMSAIPSTETWRRTVAPKATLKAACWGRRGRLALSVAVLLHLVLKKGGFVAATYGKVAENWSKFHREETKGRENDLVFPEKGWKTWRTLWKITSS